MSARRILFIGNSFTMGSGDDAIFGVGGIPYLVADFAAAAGCERPETTLCALGGKHFYEHLTDETGAMSAIRQGGWDDVVLQEYSTFPTVAGDVTRFLVDGAALHRAIRAATPTARTVLYETWARQATHPLVCGDRAAFPGGWQHMQIQLNENYHALAQALGPSAIVAPVGEIWQLLLQQPDALRLHAGDDYHAGRNGSYAAAAVLTKTLFGTLPPSLPLTEGMDETDAQRILDTVRQAMP